ncbi:MAG: peptidoglycan-binding domain-containing protein [bacterium]
MTIDKIKRWLRAVGVGSVVTLGLLVVPNYASAVAFAVSYPQDSVIHMDGIGADITVLATSTATSVAVTSTTFTVVLGASDTFKLRWAGPNPGALVNGGGLASCTRVGANNDLTFSGARTVVFTPAASPICVASGGVSNPTREAATVSLTAPNGGERILAGTNYNVSYLSTGSDTQGIRLTLSYDGGATYTTMVAASSLGFNNYSWAVPSNTAATTNAFMKAEALGALGEVLAVDVSNAPFTIVAAAPVSSGGGGGGGGFSPSPTPVTPVVAPIPVVAPYVAGSYDPDGAAGTASDINGDKSLTAPVDNSAALCTPGSLIKASGPAVYFCGYNGKRYVFPNQFVYNTWFTGFGNITVMSDSNLAKMMIGGNVTYRPGKRMIKITSDPRVYVVAKGGILRPIADEATARALYGYDWNKMIDDVSDSLFVNYQIGDMVYFSNVVSPLVTVSAVSVPVAEPAPVQEVASACVKETTFTSYMVLGSSDAQVKPMQNLLKCLGHLSAETLANGYFGNVTLSAVKAFQAASGLEQLGIVGPGTREALNKY